MKFPGLIDANRMLSPDDVETSFATRTMVDTRRCIVLQGQNSVDLALDVLHALYGEAWTAVLSPRLPDATALELGRALDAAPCDGSARTVLATSGSRGMPRLVVHGMQAHAVSARAANNTMPLESDDRWLCVLSLAHIGGLAPLFRAAEVGASVVFGAPGQSLEDALDNGITHVSLVPVQLRRLLNSGRSFAELKAVLVGGAATPQAWVDEARDAGLPVHTTWGMTETASQVVTGGRVLDGREVRLDDVGQVLVRGDTLLDGYLEEGAVVDVRDPDGWFATGDLGRWDENGCLVVEGRLDRMFVSGGENIHPEAIEHALLQAGADRAAVVAHSDATWGQRPIAFVEGDVDETTLASLLPDFMRPDRIEPLPAAAITPSGKIDLAALGEC